MALTTIAVYTKLVVIDNVDKIIIEHLNRDSSVSTAHIHKDLTEKGILLTSRSVLNRIKRLEKHKVILGYTVRLNPALFAEKCCVELLDGTDGTLTIDMQNRFSDLFS